MRRLLVVLAIAALAVPAFAQLPTGTISGRVTDGNEALPGVTVTVTSPALQGSRTAVTTLAGDYVFQFLPPGEYKVLFELQGFQTIDARVKINAAQTTKLDATMPLSSIAETITVTGSVETISASAPVATTYEKDFLEELPINRDVTNYVALTPGVSTTGPGGNISVGGAMTFETLYMVNGVSVSENLRGQVIPLYIEDAIEETTTQISNVSAEYGRFTGGIVNALTKSGGNEFHGSFRTNLTNEKWAAATPKTISRRDQIDKNYEATLGGKILTDKLWFFLAGRSAETSGSGDIYDINLDPVRTLPTGTDETRYEGKLTFSPVPDHRIVGSYFEREREWTNYVFYPQYYPPLDDAQYYDRSIPEDIMALHYNGVLSSSFFIEGQYSERNLTFKNSGSRFTDLIDGTPVWDSTTGAIFNSPIFCAACTGADEERNSEEMLLKASWYLSSEKLGSHDIRFGVNRFNDIRLANNWQSGSSYFLWADSVWQQGGELYPVVTGNSYLEWWPIFEFSKGTEFVTDSVFVNDVWRLTPNLTFNIGLRYDRNDGKDASGTKVVKDSKFSPRLGVTWDPMGDGEWQVTAGYGKYVAAIANSVADSQAQGGQPAYYNIFYDGPAINVDGPQYTTDEALQIVFNWLNGVGGVLNNTHLWGPYAPNVPGYQTFIGDDLKSPSVDEFTLGVIKRLGSKGLVRLDYVNREWTDFYNTRVTMQTGTVTDPNGIEYDRNVIENTDGLSRKYYAFMLQGQYRFTDALTAGGNYTYSHAYGNVDGENAGSGPLTAGVNYYPEFTDPSWNRPSGDLATDQRHRVNLYATYDIFNTAHNSLSASAIYHFESGSPYGASSGYTRIWFADRDPGYAYAPYYGTYFFTDRDEYKTEDMSWTGLSLNYAFKFTKGIELYLQPEIINLFNEQAVVAPNTTVYTAYYGRGLSEFDPMAESPVECPQAASSAECSAMGAHWKKGPNFGKATSAAGYQQPRTFRVSVGIRF